MAQGKEIFCKETLCQNIKDESNQYRSKSSSKRAVEGVQTSTEDNIPHPVAVAEGRRIRLGLVSSCPPSRQLHRIVASGRAVLAGTKALQPPLVFALHRSKRSYHSLLVTLCQSGPLADSSLPAGQKWVVDSPSVVQGRKQDSGLSCPAVEHMSEGNSSPAVQSPLCIAEDSMLAAGTDLAGMAEREWLALECWKEVYQRDGLDKKPCVNVDSSHVHNHYH